MKNRISNAIVPITKRDLVTCKRCGCPDLAWVKYKSGKSGLVKTACDRPFWAGYGPAPVGLWALKFNFHDCNEYREQQAEFERRASLPHPKADNPAEILADAMKHVPIAEAAQLKNFQILSDESSPIGQAFLILLDAQSKISNLK